MLFITLFFLLLTEAIHAETYYSTSAGGVGAVYTMSNEVPKNQILVHRLTANGNLSLETAVDTGGVGGPAPFPDPLVSQGSLVVYSNYLFAVNAGSNTLSMFVICPWDATQIKLISVQRTYGFYPVSVAVNNKYACVITGGNVTGVRCFTYNSYGLSIVPSFDRDTTTYVSQTIPPTPPFNTISQILFSADNRALIISAISPSLNDSGYLLFFLFNSARTQLSSKPIKRIPPGALGLVGMILIGNDGLLVTEGARNGVFTMRYSSTTGAISNVKFTPVTGPMPISLICWVVYSPILGTYYITAPGISHFFELSVNLKSTSNPVQVVRDYPISNSSNVLDATIVTLAGTDYLYIIGVNELVINGFRLNAVGQATLHTVAKPPPGAEQNIRELAGIAAFVQTRSLYSQYSRCRPSKTCFAKRDSYFDC